MASPPYSSHTPSALSPPYPSHTQLPPLNTMTGRKRSAADGTPAPGLKRRKASTMSAASATSAHPLRQTSFPPDEVGTPMTARSPSVDVDGASLVSGSQPGGAAQNKRKRGRKPKADKAREQTPSAAGGRAGTAASGVSGPKSNAGAPGDAPDEDEAEDEPDTEMLNTERSEHDRKEEKKLRAALMECMDIDQFDRISSWRAAKLPDQSIRRLVNATVSQSVPANVVTAVRSVTKYLITDIIAKALRVQDEWIQANDEKQAGGEWPGMVLARDGPEVRASYEQQAKMTGEAVQRDASQHILKEPPKGPLRPDHVREAWRRYKASMQNNGAGSLTLWNAQQHNGVERFPVRVGGKRVFK